MKNDTSNITLYRILGNDLPPRHKNGQNYENAKFILDHEGPLSRCRRDWIVNRILDKKMEQKIIRLLETYKEPYLHIPFDFKEYQRSKSRKIPAWIISAFGEELNSRSKLERWNKINYATNINPSKNLALREGRKISDWVIPMDGCCCFTKGGWREIIEKLAVQKKMNKNFYISTYRLSDNKQYFIFDRNKDKFKETEPQLIFGKNTRVRFNENLRYGRFNKVEFFFRLGFRTKLMPEGRIITDPKFKCGYSVRLSAGPKGAFNSMRERNVLRHRAVDLLIEKLDS
jgi:hypothetical protein